MKRVDTRPSPESEREELVGKIEADLAAGDHAALRERAVGLHPAELTAAVEGLEASHQHLLFEVVPPAVGAAVLSELDELSLRHVVEDLDAERLLPLLAEMAPEAATEVVEQLPQERRSRLVAELPEALAAEVSRRLLYPEDSAGRIMTVVVPTVGADRSVAEATEALRRRFSDRESVDAVFAVDEDDRLLGRISPFQLLLARPGDPVEPLVHRDAPSIPPDMDQEEAADLAVRYDLVALPVTDDDGRLLGIVPFDDIFDVIEEEDVEDLSYAAGTGSDAPTERTATRAIRARLPWLVVGRVGGVASAAVLSRFQGSLDRLVSLAFFVPVVLGLAGGAAIQSSSLTVRGLATGSIGLRRLPAVAWRELRVSIGMGAALGVLLGIAAFLLTGRDPAVAASLFLVLVLVLVTAAIGGTLIPVALQKVGVDPAVAMGPFVTTLSDVVSLSIYLSVATALLD
jgi:magnesium transporter